MISSYIGREPLLLKDEFNAIDSYHLMLIDFCFNASLPVNLALTAYNLYKKNRNQRKLNLITNNTKELLFAAMYITLHNSGSSYTLKEIVAHSNTDVKTLSRLTKIYFEKDAFPLDSLIFYLLICAFIPTGNFNIFFLLMDLLKNYRVKSRNF